MLTWDNFFDFSDDKPIDEAIQGIEKLQSVYQKMIAAVEDSNQRIAEDFSAVQTNAQELLKTVSKLSMGMEQSSKALSESSGQSENLVKEYMALKTVQSDNVKTIQTLQAELTKLGATKEAVKKNTQNEAGSLDDLRIRLAEAEKAYKAMGEATDQAVKDEQLENVRGLAAEYKNVNGALSDAKKGAVAAAGSYNELSKRVADAKKRLKEMEGGLDGNSQEFKELQKFAKEGTEQLKEWDEAVGDNQRNVGNYKDAFGSISPALSGAVDGFGQLSKAMWTLAANPVGAIILAIAAALGSLMAYFKGSIEGQDDFNKVLRIGEAIFETLMDVVEAVGKVIFDAITKPKETWEKFMKLIEPLGEKLKWAFENPLDAIKEFGQLIITHVINRVVGLGKVFEAMWKIIKSGFTEGYEDLANAAIQAATGVEDGVDKIKEALEPLQEELERRIALAEKIAALENKLRKERIADITDDAKTELEVNKLLLESKDKLMFSDEQRFNKLRKANALLEDQLKGDLELAREEIELQKLIIQQEGETYEEREKLANLQSAEIELQSQFIAARKKRQQAEIALIREIEKDIIDSQKRISDANKALNTVRLNDAIATNNKILADEFSTLDERLAAIMANDAAQQKLLEQDRDAQIAIAKEAALGRIELSADMIEKIYNQENLSIVQRIEMERKAKEELLASDEAYMTETLKIQEDFNNKSGSLLEANKKLAEDNAFKVLARDADIFAAKYNTSINEQLKALNDSFAAGDIKSIEDFEKQKLAIEKQAQEESINQQIDYLKKRAELLKEGSLERTQVEEKISALELQLSKNTAAERLKTEEDLQEAIKNLKQVAFDGAMEIIANLNDAAEEDRELQLEKLNEQREKELALAGDNEEAKAKIQADFDAKQRKIEAEQAQAARKRAIFEKAVAITQAGVNTALAVSKALASSPPPANFILAALVGAAGAIQIAAIASKQIPQFAEGTDDAPQGWAIVNELGPELIVDPSGKQRIIGTDGPTLAYLQGGSKVYTADETKSIIEHEQFANGVGVLKDGVNTVIEVTQPNDQRELIDTINRRMMSVEHAVRSKKEFSMNLTRAGVEMMLRNAETRTKFLNEYFR